MVVFACNACGESLKKNQVENHYLRKCRNCHVLSCLDCGKDFWGNDYEQHTKCVTEEEKYSGKNFVAKPSSNKNEQKQQLWIQQVQAAVDKCSANPRLKAVLIKLKDQPNVPRKKNKFTNFLANGFHVRDPNLASQVWDMLIENTDLGKQNASASGGNSSNNNDSTDLCKDAEVNQMSTDTNDCTGETKSDQDSHETGSDNKKLSKRERKEARRKQAHKAEKKDRKTVTENGETENEPKVENGTKVDSVEPKGKKSKKRQKNVEEDAEESACMMEDNLNTSQEPVDDDAEADEEPAKKKFRTKFDWRSTILEVLQSKGKEMKMKKLRKRVLAEYLSQGCTEVSEEKLWARFEKKLKRIPEIALVADRVKLKTVC